MFKCCLKAPVSGLVQICASPFTEKVVIFLSNCEETETKLDASTQQEEDQCSAQECDLSCDEVSRSS